MEIDRLNQLGVRPAQEGDLAFLNALLAHEAENEGRRFTYPDCSTAQELIDELRAHGLAFEQGISIVECSGQPLGCFGFLFDPREQAESSAGTAAFLFGPLPADAVRPSDLMRAMLDAAEREAANRGLRRVRSCVADADLIDVLTQRHWVLEQRSLEMKLECRSTTDPDRPDASTKLLQSGAPQLVEASNLLGRTFGWGRDAARRLQRALDDGYEVACVEWNGEIAGVAIWYGVAPFARIENIAVREDRRRSGIGSGDLRGCNLDHVFRAIISKGAIRPIEMFSIMFRTWPCRLSPINVCSPSGAGLSAADIFDCNRWK